MGKNRQNPGAIGGTGVHPFGAVHMGGNMSFMKENYLKNSKNGMVASTTNPGVLI